MTTYIAASLERTAHKVIASWALEQNIEQMGEWNDGWYPLHCYDIKSTVRAKKLMGGGIRYLFLSENITEWFLTNGGQSFQHIFAITSKASFLEDGSLREGGRKGVKLSRKGGELGAETHGRQGVQV